MTSNKPEWYPMLAPYEHPDTRKAIWQLADTLLPYGALWYLMHRTIRADYSYGITLALAVVAAGLLVRIFILFHDCTHGAFVASRRGNALIGYLCGILTFTPYASWRHAHARHHATNSDLDRRGTGDVPTWTVEEYLGSSRWKRFRYRLLRHPLILFGLGPAYLFLLLYRFPKKGDRQRERLSVQLTNLGLLVILASAMLTIGLREYLMIQLPIILIATTIGVWLFYIQHQFEGMYWARHQDWDPIKAALEGSSYYKLPKLLQWFTGNIGLHPIHHMRPGIPNYHLQHCYDAIPAFQAIPPITLRQSLKSLKLKLWDERQQQLIGFRALKHHSKPTA